MTDTEPDAGHGGGHDAGVDEAGPEPQKPVKGLSVSTDGYALRLESSAVPVGTTAPFAFTSAGVREAVEMMHGAQTSRLDSIGRDAA